MNLFFKKRKRELMHAECGLCGKIGHTRDMVEASIVRKNCFTFGPLHEECYMKENNLKKCDCGGSGYIKKKGGK